MRTVERPVEDWSDSTPNALDQLAIRLIAVSNLTKEASDIINKHLQRSDNGN